MLTRIGVHSGVEQLSAIEISDLITNKVDEDDFFIKTPYFQNTYTTLCDLVRSKKSDSAKAKRIFTSPASTPAQGSIVLKKRQTTSTSDQRPRKRSKSPRKQPQNSSSTEPTTPDQPAVVPNPNLSGGTNESTDEELTRDFIKSFLLDTRRCLSKDFRSFAWSRSDVEAQLALGYLSGSSSLIYTALIQLTFIWAWSQSRRRMMEAIISRSWKKPPLLSRKMVIMLWNIRRKNGLTGFMEDERLCPCCQSRYSMPHIILMHRQNAKNINLVTTTTSSIDTPRKFLQRC